MKYLVAKSYQDMTQIGESYDRDGKKYVKVKGLCQRCGGQGTFFVGVLNGYGIPARPDGGVCYECHGSGYIVKEARVYTEKEMAAQERARQRREEKKAIERERRIASKQSKWYERNGFNEDHKTYIIVGDTYAIKDELKEKGCKFNRELGWHCAQEIEVSEEYKVVAASFEDLYEFNSSYVIEPEFIGEEVMKQILESAPTKSNSEYEGKIGERLRGLKVTFKNVSEPFEGYYGTTWCYTFLHGDNILNWWTTKVCDYEVGDALTLTGTVKKQEVYRGNKVTYLNRCIIKED